MDAEKIAIEADLFDARAQFQLHNLLGYVYTEQRNMELSLRSNEISLRVSLDSLGSNSRQTANAYNNYGNALEVVREFDRALAYHHQARLIWHQLDSSQLYIRHAKRTNWLNLGASHRGLMNLDSAEFYMQKALTETQSEPAASFGIRIRAYNNLSVIFLRLGKFREAEAFVQQAIHEADSAQQWIQSGIFHHNLADIYEAQGKWEKAIDVSHRAIQVKLRELPPDHLSLFETKYNIGKLYVNWNRLDSAEFYYQQVLNRVGDTKPEEVLLRGLALSGLGTLSSQKGNLKKAEFYLSKAIKLEEQFADGIGEFARKYSSLGVCLAKQ
ncbi:MAG: tetratricopeptide repeat protein, partial [Bacteroidota bacterium]